MNMKKECLARLEESEQYVKDYESVRQELESLDRDYLEELSKHNAAKLRIDRLLNESKDEQQSFKQQIDILQKKVESCQRDQMERANDKVMEAELERMHEVVSELKEAKKRMQDQLDNQNESIKDAQAENFKLKREYQKVNI
jgi:chromosome segregation ATPase